MSLEAAKAQSDVVWWRIVKTFQKVPRGNPNDFQEGDTMKPPVELEVRKPATEYIQPSNEVIIRLIILIITEYIYTI